MITLKQITSFSEILSVEDYIVLGAKTTGKDLLSDRLVEVGMLRVAGGRVVNQNSTLIDPEIPIPARAAALTGIADQDVAGAPTYERLAPSFAKILLGQVVAAHDANLSLRFIADMLEAFGFEGEIRFIDTLGCARAAFPHERDYSLPALVKTLGLAGEEPCTALDDAQCCFELLAACKEQPVEDQPRRSARRERAETAPADEEDSFSLFGFSLRKDLLWWILSGVCLLGGVLLLPSYASIPLLLGGIAALPPLRGLIERFNLSERILLIAVAVLLVAGIVLTPMALKSGSGLIGKLTTPAKPVVTVAPTVEPTQEPEETSAPEPTPEPTPEMNFPRAATIDGEGVNFRTEPSTSAPIIATYKRGKAVIVTGVSGDWAACTIDGKTGYISAQFIKYDD